MVFTNTDCNKKFSTPGYGSLGHSREVLIQLYKQGWDKGFLGQFMYLSEKGLDEVENGYTDLIGLDCAKLEFLMNETNELSKTHQKPLQDVCLELMNNDPVLLAKGVIDAILSR